MRRVHEGQPVLGICGGYQMMGERILDPLGVESSEPDVAGLGLLPVVTRFEKEKSTAPVSLRLGEGLPGMRAAGGAEVRGYEIHCGQVTVAPGAQPFGMRVRPGEGQEPEGCMARGGKVAGTLVHGLFENVPVRRALLSELGVVTAGFAPADPYEVLSDHFASALDLAHLDQMVGL